MKDFDKLNKFFEKVKTIGFFERLFSWKKFQQLSFEAYEDFIKLKDYFEKGDEKEREFQELKKKLEQLQEKDKINQKKLTEFETTKEQRQKDYEKNMEKLLKLEENFQKKEEKLQKERDKEIEQRFEDMKKQWKVHEDEVEQLIKNICKKYTIGYIPKTKVPFKGSPDNCIKIASEYIIFDAKSPKDNNLDNFPKYLKDQVKQAKKYAKIKDVKKEIFLVVPSNTIQQIKQFSYNMVDYSVFIITPDAIEPIILSLQKIEDYEFTEELSPEERQHICRIIGKFAHTSKRRIQVDHFFTKEFIDILGRCYDLPKEILDGAIEAEKSGMLNPPMEKRAKQISNKKLKDSSDRIKREAEAKNINMDEDFSDIEKKKLNKSKK
jgi:rubrerythrin